MAHVMKECRVCGKPYEACRTQSVPGVFRWQEVACSPACGEEYLRRILESRSTAGAANAPNLPEKEEAPKTKQQRKSERRERERLAREAEAAAISEEQEAETAPETTGEEDAE